MSGGHFNYNQHRILYIKEAIEHKIEIQGQQTEYGDTYKIFEPDVLQHLKEAIEVLKKAYVYAQRIDWYFSGDDGEESFLRRLKEELNEL